MNKETLKSSKSFWNKFYKHDGAPGNPSSFSQFCIELIDKKQTLLELGCGNGRDSYFFSKNDIDVIALDSSETVITENKKLESSNLSFQQMDFTNIGSALSTKIGSIYSRFTMHTVDKEGYKRTLKYCGDKLEKGGMLFIEARTINDPLYGKGEACPDDGYIETHYRRFLRMKDTMKDLLDEGFELEYAVEDFLSSWYKNDHAVVLRIIARKK